MAKAGRKAAARLAARQAAYDNAKHGGRTSAGHDQHRPGSKNKNKH